MRTILFGVGAFVLLVSYPVHSKSPFNLMSVSDEKLAKEHQDSSHTHNGKDMGVDKTHEKHSKGKGKGKGKKKHNKKRK